MKEPPGGRAASDADQVTRLTAETVAARHARLWAWVFIAVGVGCILLGGSLFAVNHTGHNVVATVTHEGPCSNGTCTVHVSYSAGGRQVSAVMDGVPSGEVYGAPWPRLNITYQSGYETDPTTNDMPDGIGIGFGAIGLACVGFGAWRLRRKGHQRKLTVAAADGEPPAKPGLYPDPGGQPGLRRWDSREWSPFLLRADPASATPDRAKAPAEVWSPLAGSELQWHDAAGRVRRAGIVFAVWLVVALIALAGAETLFLWASKTHHSYSAASLAFAAGLFALAKVYETWQRRNDLRKINPAGKKSPGPLVNGDEGGDARFGGGPGDLGGRTGTLSWLARRKQETARRKEMWQGFAQQPGTHLRWESAGGRPGKLRTAEQQTIATVGRPPLTGIEERMTVSAGGRSFTFKKLLDPGYPPSWPPGIAEILGHPEGQKLTHAVRRRADRLRELVDEAGTRVLYTDGEHFGLRAQGCLTFPDQRRLEFPVWGRRKAHAIMTAVDQDGNKVAQYRAPTRRRQTVEIVVHSDWTLTDEIVLVIAISAPWLHSYFETPGGGG